MSNIGAKTLIKCNVALTDFVSLNTALLSNVLWSEGIISTELQREVLEQQYSSASKVVSCLIDRVEVNEEDFFVLLRILGSIDCSEDIVGIIQKEYLNLGGVLKYKSNGNTSQSKMNKNGNSSKDTAEKSLRERKMNKLEEPRREKTDSHSVETWSYYNCKPFYWIILLGILAFVVVTVIIFT